MLAVANKKTAKLHLPVPYVEADAMQLSFADKSFDAVTIAFGLRNLSNFEEGLKELRPCLEARRNARRSRILRTARSRL